MKNDIDWDKHQWNVISASANERIIVDAGPGTGKTAVACKRLAYLIEEEDLEATNTLMISFTRAAVKEILSRLYSYVGEESYGIRVATIDSHAWAIHSGYVANATLTGTFEENIERVIKLMETDEDVEEELLAVEHVVIDEAQDIVGVRAEFVETLIRQLSPSCGVTMFVDEAQAIYNFSDENIGKRQTSVVQPIHERLKTLRRHGFKNAKLKIIHRTSVKGLKSIFSDLREEIIEPSHHQEGLFEETSRRVRKCANEYVEEFIDVKVDDYGKNTLLLYRTRMEVLNASQFSKKPHKVRMSEYGPTLPSWLAQCFWDFTDKFLTKDRFVKIWMNRIPKSARKTSYAERRWKNLVRVAGREDESLSMEKLRKRLSQVRPPVELATMEFGLKGPIAGTIHASKGREIDNAVLIMPRDSNFEDIDDEVEETRVLFVGATRAKFSLIVCNSSKSIWTKTLESGRVFRKNKGGSFQVEMGRDGDLNPRGLVGKKGQSQADALNGQQYLSRRANQVSTFSLEADPSYKWRYRIKTSEKNICLGHMSHQVNRDAWEILKVNNQSDARYPPMSIKYLKSLGSRSVVLAENDGELDELHEPWSKSGFVLAPRIVSFPPLYFGWKKNNER